MGYDPKDYTPDEVAAMLSVTRRTRDTDPGPAIHSAASDKRPGNAEALLGNPSQAQIDALNASTREIAMHGVGAPAFRDGFALGTTQPEVVTAATNYRLIPKLG